LCSYRGLPDTVWEDIIIACSLQKPDYNPRVAETLGGNDIRKKGHIFQDRKAYEELRLSASDLGGAEQLVTGTWKEPAERE
jgi:hypothetical protein